MTNLTRRSIEDQIENLIAMLDSLDGDPDFELSADEEPSLGWTDRGPMPVWSDADPCREPGDDREQDNADLEDGADDEPMLGWPCHMTDQRQIAFDAPVTAATDDCEEENEHGGDVVDEMHDADFDNETSMGWSEKQSQYGVGEPGDYWSADEGMAGGLRFRGEGHEEARKLLGKPSDSDARWLIEDARLVPVR